MAHKTAPSEKNQNSSLDQNRCRNVASRKQVKNVSGRNPRRRQEEEANHGIEVAERNRPRRRARMRRRRAARSACGADAWSSCGYRSFTMLSPATIDRGSIPFRASNSRRPDSRSRKTAGTRTANLPIGFKLGRGRRHFIRSQSGDSRSRGHNPTPGPCMRRCGNRP